MTERPKRSRKLPELKTPVAIGFDLEPIYAVDISRENEAAIKAKLPVDLDGVKVEPRIVDGDIRAHFLIIGTPVPGNRLGHSETSDEHKNMQKHLTNHLRNAKHEVDFFTGGPCNDNFWREDVPILSLKDRSIYDWVQDPMTRIWVTSEEYLQPDIAGRDQLRFSASPTYPSVILEIVHHHWPDEDTWYHLVELSKANFVVAFYCITKKLSHWAMGSYKVHNQPRLRIRVQLYLKDGKLHEGIDLVPISGVTKGERYKSVRGYFAGIKKKYLEEEQKKKKKAAERHAKKVAAQAENQSGSE